jgi:hypothetical protein
MSAVIFDEKNDFSRRSRYLNKRSGMKGLSSLMVEREWVEDEHQANKILIFVAISAALLAILIPVFFGAKTNKDINEPDPDELLQIQNRQ